MPIYLRITLSSKRAEVSTGRECEAGKWNAAAGRVNGTKEATKSPNRYLDSLQEKVYEAFCQLAEEGATVTAESLKNKFTGKEE